ncbi:hypothetical protein [Actinacidiphila paucisporea]|uniref:DUF1440 domain-containing protein n=1 Tax=Actinacidiphila paucisporea TaxID=310782 RepID=A0A1M7NI01_9ACTN|nr:hypothetical protein [Actinacidiphila paucisporea]SHN02855.1 hypothetical protein SAMN05216499_118131 [Actinacidiphila paucisporea]
MNCVTRPLLYGAAAGAAGTTALNIVSYADMALRARPASSTPEVSLRKLAAKLHVRIPGEGEELDNRVAGLAPLTGFASGLAMGAVLALARSAGWRPSKAPEYVVAAVGALIGTNGPMTFLGVTDPRTWSASDWVSDIVPHLAYAAVTTAVLDRMYATASG